MSKTDSSHTDEMPQQPSQQCSKYLHDYIKCIYHDESCCADLYEKYKICMMKQAHLMRPVISMQCQLHSNS